MKKRAAPAADSDFLDIIDDRAERGGAPDPGAPTWRLLIVDDVHFLAGKRATLVELLYTVDTLIREGKQLVFAADRAQPKP